MALDFLKGKHFKALLDEELKTSDNLRKELNLLRSRQLSAEQMSLIQLEEEIDKKKVELQGKQSEITNLKEEMESYQNKIDEYKQETEKMKEYIINAEEIISMQDFGLYIPRYDFATSIAYKAELDIIRNRQKEMIKEEEAVSVESISYNNSEAKGKQILKKQAKLMIRAFNTECEAAIYKVKFSNLQTIEKRITKSFNDINKLSGFGLCEISSNYLDLKIQELYLAYEYERKKEEEKEILREQREKEKEEKALQKEIDAKKKILDKEIKQFTNAINALKEKMNIADTEEEKEALHQEIESLQNQINEHESEKEDLDYRVAHASAGYVYIISNIGSFGEGVVKIGVTRRLDPLERISELSSASVPFKYDIHALIFSNEAYQLESYLHKKFEANRVNMINLRKEFFKIDINEIKKVLEAEFKELTVEFNETPDAEEYRQTLQLSNA